MITEDKARAACKEYVEMVRKFETYAEGGLVFDDPSGAVFPLFFRPEKAVPLERIYLAASHVETRRVPLFVSDRPKIIVAETAIMTDSFFRVRLLAREFVAGPRGGNTMAELLLLDESFGLAKWSESKRAIFDISVECVPKICEEISVALASADDEVKAWLSAVKRVMDIHID